MLHCKYCGRICKNKNSLVQHEIRCKQNPDRIICYGNKQQTFKQHNKKYYTEKYNYNGNILNVTKYDIDKYKEKQLTCEICGRALEETIKTKTKFSPKSLCIDHDHKTNEFRGLLCLLYNRQLGWYEKHKEEIEKYLNKGSIG